MNDDRDTKEAAGTLLLLVISIPATVFLIRLAWLLAGHLGGGCP